MNNIKLFESKKIRSQWDTDTERWYFSIVDVIEILTESPNPRKYWSVLKTRLNTEGSQLTTNCSQLKMQSADGKFYKRKAIEAKSGKKIVSPINSKQLKQRTERKKIK